MRLSLLGLPNIQTLEDLSIFTHISKHTLYQLSFHSEKHYKVYTIPKKNGSLRKISQPSKKLKAIQAWILNNILNRLTVSGACKGFEKGTSIKDNAAVHIGANSLMILDIKDFFPSVSRNMIYNIFKAIGYNKIISTIFTNFCAFENGLPQGGPCSPKLANLCTWKLDKRIQGFVGKQGIIYSRYADDLSFSCPNPNTLTKNQRFITSIVNDEKFKINSSKTRISGPSRLKKVTGLVLTDNNFGIGVKRYRIFRSRIHKLTLTKNQSNLTLLRSVQGYLSFLNDVDKNGFSKSIKYIKELSLKYPATLVSKII